MEQELQLLKDNVAKLEELVAKLQFINREVTYLLGVEHDLRRHTYKTESQGL